MPPILPSSHRDHRRQLVVDVDRLVAFGAQTWAGVEAAEVHHRDLLDAEALQIRFHARPQLLRTLRGAHGDPVARVRVGADLAHDDDAVRRFERLADDAVDESVAVELCGVDMVDAQLCGTSQHRECRCTVAVQPLELHGAVADAGHRATGERPCATGARSSRGSGVGRGGLGEGHRAFAP